MWKWKTVPSAVWVKDIHNNWVNVTTANSLCVTETGTFKEPYELIARFHDWTYVLERYSTRNQADEALDKLIKVITGTDQ